MGTSELSPHPGRVLGLRHRLDADRAAAAGVRWLRYALWPLGVAAGIAAVSPTFSEQGLDRLDLSAALRVLAGWSFIASGLIGWTHRSGNRAGALMVAVGFLYLAPAILLQSQVPLKATIGQLLAVAFIAVFVLLLVAFPSERLSSRLDRVLVASVFIPAVPMQLLWLMVLPEPGNALLAWPDAALADAIDSAQRIIFLGAVAVLPAMLVRRWLRASPPLRRVLNPVLFGAAAVVLYGLYVLLDKVGGPAEFVDNCFRLVFAAVPIAFLVGLLRARLARSAIGDLLVELREPAPPGALRDALARAVRDRSTRRTSTRRAGRSSCRPRAPAGSRRSSSAAAYAWRRSSTTRRCARSPSSSGRSAPPRGSRSRTSACRPISALASRSSGARVRASWRPLTPSAGGSSAIFTTARSSG